MKKLQRAATVATLAAIFSMAAFADISGTATLSSGQGFKLDTGATTTSGDFIFTGTSITFVGSAIGGAIPGSGSAVYSALTQQILQSLVSFASSSAIPANSFPVNAVLGIQTNGGNAAKLLVTAVSGSSITFQYTTFGATSGGGGGGTTPTGPTITKVTNNYSYIPAGFPNSGVSPSSIITIFGSGLSAAPSGTLTLNSSSGSGLPTTSAGATVSVTAGGKTLPLALYYASPTQIAAVLPAATPTGSATITVSYNSQTSAAFTIQVVPSALGLDTYYGTGSGLVTATSATTGALYNYTSSASPGQTIVLWASGLGADTQDSDSVFTSAPHAVNQGATQIWFGGVQGTVGYAGSSGYPGLNQINVTIPASVSLGCNISVVGVVNGTTSNFGTLPIAQGGGTCSDPLLGTTGTQIGTISGQSTVKTGNVFVGQLTTSGQTESIASASFASTTGAAATASGSTISVGSCFVSQTITTGTLPSTTPLDAGTPIALTGPNGSYSLTALTKGSYVSLLTAGAIPSTGGTFVFKGPGGADVGSFTATVNMPNPLLSWTNQNAGATVNRSQGLTVTWTGGSSGSQVIISGTSSSGGASSSYTCIAPQSALTFTVPAYVLGTLPAGSGTTSVENETGFASFTATGLDLGLAFGLNGISVNSNYQ